MNSTNSNFTKEVALIKCQPGFKPMKAAFLFLLVLLMTACSSQQADPFSDLSNDELTAAFQQAQQEKPVQYCRKLVPIATLISQRDTSNHQKQASKNFAEFRCAVDGNRWDDAYTSMVIFEVVAGRSMGSVGFHIAYFANQYVDAVARLEILASATDSRDLLNIEPESFWDLFRDLSSEGNKELQKRAVDAMAESPHFQKFDPDFRSGLASRKLGYDVKDGDFSNSDKWIAELLRPTQYISMLADKKFEAIWPNLERAVGENFIDITDRYVEAMKEAYKRDISDLDAYQKVAHALVYAGKFEEAVDFVITPADAELPTITLDEAWALNMKVEALDALGRHDEGTALFESLATIPVNDKNKGWLINFTINRAARLTGYGKWKQGYEAAEYAEGFRGSAYAKMIIRRVKVCALVNQGKNVSHLLVELFENRKDSYSNAAKAMVCGGNEDLAAEILIDAFGDEAGRRDILEELQKPQFSFYVVQAESPDLHHLLGTQEELRAAFEKEGRLIPDEYMPLARIRSF